MKRSAFTLVELIFVIVIIGVLAAVAVPKFKNLKQNAEAANVIKIANDAFGSLPSVFVNIHDLEEDNTTASDLTKLIKISGKNWVYTDSSPSHANGQTFKFNDNNDTGHTVVTLTFNPVDRNATLDINCTKFIDSQTKTKCQNKLGSSSINETIEF